MPKSKKAEANEHKKLSEAIYNSVWLCGMASTMLRAIKEKPDVLAAVLKDEDAEDAYKMLGDMRDIVVKWIFANEELVEKHGIDLHSDPFQ